MPDLSIAVLVGRLTRDAELKYTTGGTALCKFSAATSTRKKQGSEWVDEASFWDIELWGKQGESLAQYLTKGKQVAVEGTMRQDRWEKDGQKHMKVVVNANTVQLLGSGQGQSSQQNSKPADPAPAQRQSPYNPDGSMREPAQDPNLFIDDDPNSIPF